MKKKTSKCLNRTIDNRCLFFNHTNLYRPWNPLQPGQSVECNLGETKGGVEMCPGFKRNPLQNIRIFEEELLELIKGTIYDINYPDVVSLIVEKRKELLELLTEFKEPSHD